MTLKTILGTALLSMTAFAGDSIQKADVNFSFRTPSGVHEAGTYHLMVRQAPASAHLELRSVETGKAVMFFPLSNLTPKRAGEQPRLVFKCGGSNCNLAEVWTFSQGFSVRQPKAGAGEPERVAVTVPMRAGATE
jgi:hypothetical protein